MDHLIPPVLFMTLTTPPRHIINTNAWLKYKQRNNIEVEADWNSNEIFADNFNKAVPRITSTNFTECIQVETTDYILQCNNSSVFLLDIDSFIKEGNFGSKTMPLLKQRTCFLGNKLHRKSCYQCDGISAIWRGLYWCFIFPLGGFSYRKELTLSWLQSTPLSMFLENNNFFKLNT